MQLELESIRRKRQLRRWIPGLMVFTMVLALGIFAAPTLAQDVPTDITTPATDTAGAEAGAEEAAEPLTLESLAAQTNEVKWMVNNLWIMLAGCLVFIMHLGFATLESGLARSKNTVNIVFKNTMIICIGLLAYALCGWSFMYPDVFVESVSGDFFAFDGFGIAGTEDAANATSAYGDYTIHTDFFFQAMFAATCATIVSGAVAERIKLSSFLVFSVLFVGIGYPILGSWDWGYGWLDDRGFTDFAGSTLVHSVGGWGALVMAILVGPRLGKINKDGTVNAIPGHNLTLACIGVFLLWFGWFGFNGGSVLSADAAGVSYVLVTTSLAAAAGGITAALISWVMNSGKPDLTMALNGVLAGLVGITAGADLMAIWQAVLIGAVAGGLVYFSVLLIDKIRIDDPVGAISVHLVCGIWGTLAVGIFGAAPLGVQALGVAAYGVGTVAFCLAIALPIKAIMGLRVSDAEQLEGLDHGEHGMSAYPDFQPLLHEV